MSRAGLQTASGLTFAQRNHFWIRRLHSLAGVLPLGVFLIFHLSANASILGGERVFDRNIELLHTTLGPLLYLVEMVFIFIPLAFHIGYGLMIARQARMNAGVYPYTANRRFSLQRISAWIATVFICYHLLHMHWMGAPLRAAGLGAYFQKFDPEFASESAAQALQSHWLISLFYALGVLCTVYHFANGLWTSLITWGVTVGQRAQRVSGVVCVLIGVLLGVAGLGSLAGFNRYRLTPPEVDRQPPTQAQRADQGAWFWSGDRALEQHG